MKTIIDFVMAMILSFIPGVVGMAFAPSGASDAWYNMLNKSVLTPDGWVFAAAWSILYILLGIALFLVMNDKKPSDVKTKSYTIFILHMILNGLWAYLFFGLHLVGTGMVIIIALLIVAWFMQKEFTSVNKYAGYLVWPYMAWLIFAAYLNISILALN